MNSDFDGALFEPEVILPGQMSWGARCDGNTSGARALMLAILQDVMLCIERGRRRRHPRTRLLAADAETWVRSDSPEWIFSFVSICDMLGIDADALRVRLLADVGHSANGVRTAYAQADEPSTRRGAALRALPRREGAQGAVAVHSVRAPARRNVGGRGGEAVFAALAHG
jgi:hypothetical protein